jgi:glutathione S-transferase
MPDIYLHHYPMSPFAEKMRLMLGYKGLPWKSVLVPSIMPKPDLVALTGGYRRVPVLQIGNQIICDTALMAEVLEHLSPEKPLYPAHAKGLARVLAQWADTQLFWAAMGYNFAPAGAQHVFRGQPPEALATFAEDRKAMRAGGPRMHPSDAASVYKSYLRRIASMLHEQSYVLGNAPCVADFAIYHALWFTRTQATPLAGILEATPDVLRWLDRMAAIGHGQMSKSDATEAIAACQVSTPANSLFGTENTFQDEHGIALGEQVSIAAESFGTEPTTGTLVAATRTRYTLHRVDARAGEVFVHFPRVGYALRKAAA